MGDCYCEACTTPGELRSRYATLKDRHAAQAREIEALEAQLAEYEEDMEGNYFGDRCAFCGHRLASAANACPQCGKFFRNPQHDPADYPDLCGCDRCDAARGEG